MDVQPILLLKRSAQREKQLHKVQSLLDHPTLKYREIHSVHWVSFYDALEAVFRTLDPLLTYFHSRGLYPVDNMEALLGLLIKQHADEDIPELIKLALIGLVLPLHTAGCERVFSHQNIIVNKLKNRLSPAQSENLLKIRLQGKGVTLHDFHRSLISFNKQKKTID